MGSMVPCIKVLVVVAHAMSEVHRVFLSSPSPLSLFFLFTALEACSLVCRVKLKRRTRRCFFQSTLHHPISYPDAKRQWSACSP